VLSSSNHQASIRDLAESEDQAVHPGRSLGEVCVHRVETLPSELKGKRGQVSTYSYHLPSRCTKVRTPRPRKLPRAPTLKLDVCRGTGAGRGGEEGAGSELGSASPPAASLPQAGSLT
jgi:hypothetical protein